MTGQGQGQGQGQGADVRTSASPDVSVVTERIAALDRHLTSELAALRRETQAANANAERAVNVAAEEATERLAAHNGLIEQMRTKEAHFATRESIETLAKTTTDRLGKIEKFQSQLTGGMILLAVIGVANLVKVWGG